MRSVHPSRGGPCSPQQRGFTLIEIIGVLVLVGISAVFVGMLLTTSMQIYLFSKDGAVDSQQTQVAMNRLIKELTWADSGTVQIPDAQTVNWVSTHPERSAAGTQTASWSGQAGTPLMLNGTPLIDDIQTFTVSAAGAAIELSLSTERSPNTPQSTRVLPRQSPL